MKKLLCYLCFCAMLMSLLPTYLLPVQASTPATTYLMETFDSYEEEETPSDLWFLHKHSDEQVGDFAKIRKDESGNGYIQLYQGTTDNGTNFEFGHELSNVNGNYAVQFRAMTDTVSSADRENGNDNKIFSIFGDDSLEPFVRVGFSGDQIAYWSSTGTTNVRATIMEIGAEWMKVTPNRWYDFKIVVRQKTVESNGSYDIYVDNNLMKKNVPFNAGVTIQGKPNKMSFFMYNNTANKSIFVDNYSVQTVQEAESGYYMFDDFNRYDSAATDLGSLFRSEYWPESFVSHSSILFENDDDDQYLTLTTSDGRAYPRLFKKIGTSGAWDAKGVTGVGSIIKENATVQFKWKSNHDSKPAYFFLRGGRADTEMTQIVKLTMEGTSLKLGYNDGSSRKPDETVGTIVQDTWYNVIIKVYPTDTVADSTFDIEVTDENGASVLTGGAKTGLKYLDDASGSGIVAVFFETKDVAGDDPKVHYGFSMDDFSILAGTDTTAPYGDFLINGGALEADNYNVAINLTGFDGETRVAEMIISESSDFNEAKYEPYNPFKQLTLSGGNGEKTVYVKFKDASGNESQPISKSITLNMDTSVTVTADIVNDAGNIVAALTPGETAKAKVSINNRSEDELAPRAILALYNEDGALSKVDIGDTVTVGRASEVEFTEDAIPSLVLPNEDGIDLTDYKLELFVWDGMKPMTPLLEDEVIRPLKFSEGLYSNWKGVTWAGAKDSWGTDDGSERVAVEDDIADMQYGGVQWVRISCKPTDTLDTLDQKVNDVVNNGFEPLMYYSKKIAPKTYGTDEEERQNAEYLASLVRRYQGKVRHWEIHNEPNLRAEWDLGENGIVKDDAAGKEGVRKYVLHLENCYKTIKSVDPSIKVIMGGITSGNHQLFMQYITEFEGYKYFDETALHPYAKTPDGVITVLTQFKSEMSNWPEPKKDMPIWITEIGWHTEDAWKESLSNSYVADEQTKANYIVEVGQKLTEALNPIRPIFYYTLHEINGSAGFGLTQKTFTDGNLTATRLTALESYRGMSVTPTN